MSDILIPVHPDLARRLWTTRRSDKESWTALIGRLLPESDAPEPHRAPAPSTRPADSGRIRYRILGEDRFAANAIDLLVDILRTLADLDPAFLARLAQRVRGRSRNHLARSPGMVYPRRPDLARTARAIAQGWYIGGNLANREKRRILTVACEVAGIKFGTDIQLSSGAPADLTSASR